MPDPKEMLAAHPFSEGMSPEELAQVAECIVSTAEFKPDEVIFRAGAISERCYLIIRGDVALEAHAPGSGAHIIQTINGGEVLGWSWMFAPYRWLYDAVALTPTEAVILDGGALRRHAGENTPLGHRVTSRMARMVYDALQATRLQLLDMYARPS